MKGLRPVTVFCENVSMLLEISPVYEGIKTGFLPCIPPLNNVRN